MYSVTSTARLEESSSVGRNSRERSAPIRLLNEPRGLARLQNDLPYPQTQAPAMTLIFAKGELIRRARGGIEFNRIKKSHPVATRGFSVIELRGGLAEELGVRRKYYPPP